MNQIAKYIGLLAILPLVMVAIAPDFIGEADAVNTGTVDDGAGDRLTNFDTRNIQSNGGTVDDGSGDRPTMRDTGQSVEKYLESVANKN